jgi:hypothetical protein
MKKQKSHLNLESLEDRLTPSGMPWPSQNLTLSFVPDGTKNLSGQPSNLFNAMANVAATRVWEMEVLRAAQTWAAAANVNIGLVNDGGQALGATGLIQGDSRFGDIRVSAEPMGAAAQLSIGSGYNPISGTHSGDIEFNSSVAWNIGSGNDLYTAALHEIGNALGMTENDDPTSAMCRTYQGPRTGLSAGDVTAFQSLYGARSPDAYEGPSGNNSLAAAAVIKLPEIAGDITTAGDADYYRYTIPSYADKTVTLTVQNGGISLLAPRLSVYNASGALIATSAAGSALNANTSITLGSVKRGTVILIKVDSASAGAFGTGAYRLKVDSGAVSQRQIAAIDATLSGSISYINFGHSSSTISTAVALDQTVYQIDPRFDYAVNAKLSGADDTDFFSIVTPAAAPQALIFTATPGRGSQLRPELTVYDANGNVVDAQILSNEQGGYVVQVLNPVAGAKYYVSASPNAFAASINDAGTYMLGINYSNTPIVLQDLVEDTLSSTDTIDVVQMWSTEVQLYHFVLSADTGSEDSSVSVVMQLLDANGNLVLSLTCQDGNTVSADVQLTQGWYTLRFIGTSSTGAPIPTTSYSLLGMNLSDPLDPIPVPPTGTGTGTTTTVTITPPPLPPILPPILPPL